MVEQVEDVVHVATADRGTFELKVTRLEERTGQMVVKVLATDEVLLDKTVPLSYGAIFGPDVSDVNDWSEQALVVMDEYLARKAATHYAKDGQSDQAPS